MPEQIISASGIQYGAIVNEDGSLNVILANPLHMNKTNNPALKLIYDGNGNISNLVKYVGTGSLIRVLTYDANNVLQTVGSWA
jgi:hypothetical protein